MSEAIKAKEIIVGEIEKEATKLLDGITSLQDTLSYIAEEILEPDTSEKTATIYANDSLLSFVDSDPNFVTANPRSIRDKDRKSILPGQHAGVFLQFGLKDGTILKINFYGGLRTLSDYDLKDSDKTLKFSHTSRTDQISIQKTHLNWQINFLGGKTIDSWITYNPNNNGSFQQSTLIIDNEYIDSHPGLSNNDPRFEVIKSTIFDTISKIVNLVPSSV